MRFRTGLLIGAAVGYYYGSKAGRERFDEIEVWLDKVRGTTTYRDAQTKLADGLREGTIAARNLVAGTPLGSAVRFASDEADDRAAFDSPPFLSSRPNPS